MGFVVHRYARLLDQGQRLARQFQRLLVLPLLLPDPAAVQPRVGQAPVIPALAVAPLGHFRQRQCLLRPAQHIGDAGLEQRQPWNAVSQRDR
jgi:hypothetical protein